MYPPSAALVTLTGTPPGTAYPEPSTGSGAAWPAEASAMAAALYSARAEDVALLEKRPLPTSVGDWPRSSRQPRFEKMHGPGLVDVSQPGIVAGR
jgi:hypothetical protein